MVLVLEVWDPPAPGTGRACPPRHASPTELLVLAPWGGPGACTVGHIWEKQGPGDWEEACALC